MGSNAAPGLLPNCPCTLCGASCSVAPTGHPYGMSITRPPPGRTLPRRAAGLGEEGGNSS